MEIFASILTIYTCTSSITMSNNTELHGPEYIVPLCVLNAFFALTAVVLNSVTIHAIRETSSASLPKNLRVLLLNLAFSDLSVGLLVQPLYIIHLTFTLESHQGDYSQKVELVFIVMATVFVCISILGVLAVSVDRFLAVYLHLRYHEIVTPKRVVSILILSWVISTIVSLFWIGQEYRDCLRIFLNVFLATCLPTIGLLQFKIYSIVRRHRFQMRAQQVQGSIQTEDETRTTFERQNSSVTSAFYIYLLLLACYLPNLFLDFALITFKGRILWIFQQYMLTLMFVNSCLNPFIYCWKLRHIRRTIRIILRSIFVRGTCSGTGSCGN